MTDRPDAAPPPWFHRRDADDSATPFVVYRRMGPDQVVAHARFQHAAEAVVVVQALNALHTSRSGPGCHPQEDA